MRMDASPSGSVSGTIVWHNSIDEVDYLAMKRLRLNPTRQIEPMMALAIIMVLAALIYYGRLVWLLFSLD